MRRLALFAALLLAASCDPVVASVPVDQPHVEVAQIGCSYTGFCYTCMPGFNGKLECGFKVSTMCSGTQDAQFMVQHHKVTYKSGRTAVIEMQQFEHAVTECAA